MPSCQICGNELLSFASQKTGARNSSLQQSAILVCPNCGLHTLRSHPNLHQLRSLYDVGYEPYWEPLEESGRFVRWARRRNLAFRSNAVRRVQPEPGLVLDIGCGTGGFLRALCCDGTWLGVGLDIIEQALVVANGQGVSTVCGVAGSLLFKTAVFDVVTMWEVLEHLPQPGQALREAHRVLRQNGLLLMSTPNGESLQAGFWRHHWPGWDIPRHLQIFSRGSLTHLLEDSGFVIIREFVIPTEQFYAVESAYSWLEARYGLSHTRRRIVQGAAWLLWPFFRIIDCAPISSTISLVAQKVN